MSHDPAPATGSGQPHAHERRRSPRFVPQEVDSLLGEVLDLSVTGMRVRHHGPMLLEVGETFDLLLLHRARDVLLPVRVVRIEPAGGGRHTIGLEITRDSPDLQRCILAMKPRAQPAGAAAGDESEELPQAYRLRQTQHG